MRKEGREGLERRKEEGRREGPPSMPMPTNGAKIIFAFGP
jgi:hypothetical protein